MHTPWTDDCDRCSAGAFRNREERIRPISLSRRIEAILSRLVLGEQDDVTKIFETRLDKDRTDSGRIRRTEALGVLAQAPEVTDLLDRLSAKVKRVFSSPKRKSKKSDSPLVEIMEQMRKQEES